MILNIDKTCERCGECCRKGGPVLHLSDREIMLAGHAGHADLVTLRKGETVMNPVSGRLEACQREMIKVRGAGTGWVCIFHQGQDRSCKIYPHRFLECRVLKCWDAAGIMAVMGKDLIARADLINPSDPVHELISMHEAECPSVEIRQLTHEALYGKDKLTAMKRLSEIVRLDRAVRSYAVSDCGLNREHEQFIFGQPVLKLLSASGIVVPW
jgi:Fe-S-cluster containining protein